MLNAQSQFLADYLDKGGFVFITLLLLSIISLSIIFFKIFQFWKLGSIKIDKISSSIKEYENIDVFVKENSNFANSKNLFAKIFIKSTKVLQKKNTSQNEKVSEVESLVFQEFKIIEKYLPTLDIISQVSPLLGLLGTVVGMIDSFNKLEIGGTLVDPSVLAGGIWTALLTTAVGLIVAIPALVANYYFEKKIESHKNSLNNLLIITNNYIK